ncbi:MAG: type I DNA topoisomerase [Alphaproteobacteria bacterium]|nr:type I DNA topoisomerase [Alphaproteobacteria bacterium]
MRLVIVESPAKSKTINKYLGADYKVMASYGHIRDLRSKDGSVLPEKDFSMVWEMSARGKKCVQDIITQLKKSDELLLATDPDREGEAISWHIKEVLQEAKKLTVPVKRIAFHEITKNAIKEAIANPREIDSSLVDAYLARRALDYLVGFTISPILWRKLPGSKSAGRVQSVALRIVVDREAEIEAFKKQEYWSIEAKFEAKNKKLFDAKLTHYNGKKLDKFAIANEETAKQIREALLPCAYSVSAVETKTVKRNPAPAFITSTLQQEASRKLGFGAKKTMQLAQNLYEGIDIDGSTTALITYMRTDSINLSQEAITKIRGLIAQKYGDNFLPEKPRLYQTKVKNAQEAHEAIRPVDANLTPESLKGKISSDLLKLYELIWKRAVACQMASAEFDQVQVDIANEKGDTFRANGNTVKFEGFLKVYVEGKDERQSDDEIEGLLPPLSQGDNTPLNELNALQHFTTPPPRFSEASLVKKLEELGIGRPSTYATILQVLQDRGYVKLVKKFFVPEIRGRLVTAFLVNFFKKYLEYDFTANMEQALDDISNGTKSKIAVLSEFWKGFCENVDKTKDIKITDVINKLNEELESFLFTNANGETSRKCPECHEGELSLKMGRFGSFIGCSRYPECKYVRKLDSEPVTEEDTAMVAAASEYPKFLGADPTDNAEISLKKGPYGLYIEKSVKSADKKSKPPRASVPKFVEADKIDLNLALSLLQLPKVLGQYENSEVKIGIGRYGPYVFHNGKYVSIPKPEDVLTITLAQAIEVLKSKGK